MSKGVTCKCKGTLEERMQNWVIIQYKCNHSAFSGYKHTSSDYSCFRCRKCQHVWRSKSDYVYTVKVLNEKNPVEDKWSNLNE